MPCYRKGRASKNRGMAAGRGERRFADGVKTMVSGEANFVDKMSFQASLIGRNDYVAYPPQRLKIIENIFHL
ncbi:MULTISPECIES: hypothetical protein [unclassified Janthinobacterium]|uniref:hypothetical protein n=1 Tax=unclassified Janthinobacterium TaxID=2610881 RepID=UPI000B86BBDD|nr:MULTISPECIES: hypothetical protein [unclassified Janthinobacterium]